MTNRVRRTVLLVEDDLEVLHVVEQMLLHLGYRVVTATNGQEALAVYQDRRHEVELVVTDLDMPELCGAGLIGALRQRDVSMPVIILSGQDREDVALNRPPGAPLQWLKKPPSLPTLDKALRRALQAD